MGYFDLETLIFLIKANKFRGHLTSVSTVTEALILGVQEVLAEQGRTLSSTRTTVKTLEAPSLRFAVRFSCFLSTLAFTVHFAWYGLSALIGMCGLSCTVVGVDRGVVADADAPFSVGAEPAKGFLGDSTARTGVCRAEPGVWNVNDDGDSLEPMGDMLGALHTSSTVQCFRLSR